MPLWVATIDFKKAFDTVSHASLWTALAEQGITPNYIQLLTRLYTHQSGQVQTDTTSREFDIQRGTKQGDPLSSLLFNAVSESIFRRLQQKWQRRGCGIHLAPPPDTALTNLRFADDVLLFATSLPQLKTMIGELAEEARSTGLELHPDKTKILHNVSRRKPQQQPDYVQINNLKVEVLPCSAAQKYLGRKLSFTTPHQIEVENRIAAAWRKFCLLKRELTTNTYPLRDRLRLFHGTVTPTALYACTSWTLTQELENRLRRTQRQMLRMILGSPRRRNNTYQNGTTTPATTNAHTTPPPTTTTLRDAKTTTTPVTTPPRTTQTMHDGTTTPPTPHNDDNDDNDDVDDNGSNTNSDDDDDNDDNDNNESDEDADNDARDADSDTPELEMPPIAAGSEDLEPWAEWIQRCTHQAEEHMRKLGIEEWVAIQRRRKWRFARQVALDKQGKWSLKAMMWDPLSDPRFNPRRRTGRPRTRWTQDICNHIRQHRRDQSHDDSPTLLFELAQDKMLWDQLEEQFVTGEQ